MWRTIRVLILLLAVAFAGLVGYSFIMKPDSLEDPIIEPVSIGTN